MWKRKARMTTSAAWDRLLRREAVSIVVEPDRMTEEVLTGSPRPAQPSGLVKVTPRPLKATKADPLDDAWSGSDIQEGLSVVPWFE